MRRPTTNRPPGTKRRRRPTPVPRASRGVAASTATPAASRTWLGTDAQVIRHVRVCGEGHLATATRIELERQGIHRDSDYLLPSLRPALVIACADSEADQSLSEAAQQALEEGSPLLLCCLAGPIVRLGPLIEPDACFAGAVWSQPASDSTAPDSPPPASPSPTSAPPVVSSRTSTSQGPPSPTSASPADRGQPPHLAQRPRQSQGSPAKPDSPLNPDARLGALLISAQALNFLLGARNQCVLDRVVELNPWSMESMAYRVFHN